MVTGAGMQITAISGGIARVKSGDSGDCRWRDSCSGDVTKGVAAGASVVMMRSLFAGVDEVGRDDSVSGQSFKGLTRNGSLSAMAQGSEREIFQGQERLEDCKRWSGLR
jgi:IMP dehydrogenase